MKVRFLQIYLVRILEVKEKFAKTHKAPNQEQWLNISKGIQRCTVFTPRSHPLPWPCNNLANSQPHNCNGLSTPGAWWPLQKPNRPKAPEQHSQGADHSEEHKSLLLPASCFTRKLRSQTPSVCNLTQLAGQTAPQPDRALTGHRE